MPNNRSDRTQGNLILRNLVLALILCSVLVNPFARATELSIKKNQLALFLEMEERAQFECEQLKKFSIGAFKAYTKGAGTTRHDKVTQARNYYEFQQLEKQAEALQREIKKSRKRVETEVRSLEKTMNVKFPSDEPIKAPLSSFSLEDATALYRRLENLERERISIEAAERKRVAGDATG